jgi:dolichyl-phosphate-mannose-protein mannosyltransferase
VISRLSSFVNRVSAHPNFYWLGTLLITLLGAALRFINLQNPHVLVFDETYYVKDAYTLGLFGFERQWGDDPNPDFEAGITSGYLDQGAYVVHPPVGKWVIWFGIQLFGVSSSFGWRFSVALLGTLAIPLIIAVARRLIGNRTFALIAGLLLAVEGHAVVLSRTSILDGILMFFVLLGFYFLVRDYQQVKQKLSAIALAGVGSTTYRPWLLLSALSLGLAAGVKWSGLYFLAAFGLYSFIYELIMRNRLGLNAFAAFGNAALNAFVMLSAAAAAYIASWSGWIRTEGGWGRGQSDNWLIALWEYHKNAYSFHTGLSSEHPYSANALQWLLSLRPTAFYYESFEGEKCGFLDSCSVAITALPNPIIWLFGLAAMLWAGYRLLRKVDLTAGLILVGFLAGWAPWLAYLSRTTFQFYAVVLSPFIVLALSYALHQFWRSGFTAFRLAKRERAITVIVVLALLLAAFFASLWMGLPVPYWYWRIQMWFPFWI